MIRKINEREKEANPKMDYRIDLPYYHYFISANQFKILKKEVENLSLHVVSKVKRAVCDNNCPYFGYQCNINEMYKDCRPHVVDADDYLAGLPTRCKECGKVIKQTEP